MTDLESIWEKISAEVIQDCEKVDCSLLDFAAGLKYVAADLLERSTMAEHEASVKERKE